MSTEQFRVESDPDLLALEDKLRDRAKNLGLATAKSTNLVSAVNEVVRIFLKNSKSGEVQVLVEEKNSIVRVTLRSADVTFDDVERIMDQKYYDFDEEDTGLSLLRARRLSDQFQVSSSLEDGMSVVLAVRRQRPKTPVYNRWNGTPTD